MSIMNENENKKSHYWSEVIHDFEKAFENGNDYDVIIKVEEDKELRAHSFVLRARCSYFQRALSDDWEERDDDGHFIFKKPNVSVEAFQLILRQVNVFDLIILVEVKVLWC